MVMSTGMISIAFEGLGFQPISRILFFVNIATYVILFPMFIARIIFFTDGFLGDIKHPKRCWGFLTFIVGTNTLGAQFYIFSGFVELAKIFWFFAFFSWLFLIYPIFINLISGTFRPIEEVIDGSSLLVVVSVQSIALLGSRLAGEFGIYSNAVLFISWTCWAAGCVLYAIIIPLVTYRLLFCSIEPKDWTGPYWICMGAAAITTLAGSILVSSMGRYPEFRLYSSATLVITLLAWAIGSCWIPILIYMDIWKFTKINISGKTPVWIKIFPWLRLGSGRDNNHFYEVPDWGRVFPLGMYTACTIALSEASGFGALFLIPKYWGWFAIIIWSLTFIGTLRSVKSGDAR